MSSRLELIENLFNFHNSMSLRLVEKRLKRWLPIVSVFSTISYGYYAETSTFGSTAFGHLVVFYLLCSLSWSHSSLLNLPVFHGQDTHPWCKLSLLYQVPLSYHWWLCDNRIQCKQRVITKPWPKRFPPYTRLLDNCTYMLAWQFLRLVIKTLARWQMTFRSKPNLICFLTTFHIKQFGGQLLDVFFLYTRIYPLHYMCNNKLWSVMKVLGYATVITLICFSAFDILFFISLIKAKKLQE